MKLLSVLILLLTVPATLVIGQVNVTGHVTAEVVDAATAHFEGKTSFVTSPSQQLELGSIQLSGNACVFCTYTLTPAKVINHAGEEYILKTLSDQPHDNLTLNNTGKHSLNIAALSTELPNGENYNGNYNITFAYN